MPNRKQYTPDTTGGHVCVLYSSPAERFKLVAEYFQQGVQQHELCIFVTPEPVDEVITRFDKVGFAAKPAVAAGDLRIFEMEPTYLPDGKFVANFMLQNVKSFYEAAKSAGYSGLRTAGEMSWLGAHPESLREAVAYEEQVNRLGIATGEFTGLCLYPLQDQFSEVIEQMLPSHPAILKNGELTLNTDFSPTD